MRGWLITISLLPFVVEMGFPPILKEDTRNVENVPDSHFWATSLCLLYRGVMPRSTQVKDRGCICWTPTVVNGACSIRDDREVGTNDGRFHSLEPMAMSRDNPAQTFTACPNVAINLG